MATQPVLPISPEEYLRLERQAATKSEYYDGEVFAMAGGTQNHSFLTSGASSIVYRQVPKGCRVFNSDMRIVIPGHRNYVYADAGLVCGTPEAPEDDLLANPALIIEVLSPSTERNDRGLKFALYQRIESFCEYLLVRQDELHVEHYSKQRDGSWIYRAHSGIEAVVNIERWGIHIPLDELYATALILREPEE